MRISGYTIRNFFTGILIHVFLLMIAVTCLFPLFWMIRTSLMTSQTVFLDHALIPGQLHWQNYVEAWVKGSFATYFLNSIIYTVAVVGGIVVMASLAAYAFSRLHFPGRNVLYYIIVGAMMIPLPGSFVPLFVMMNKLHLVNSRFGYILCMISVGLFLSIMMLKAFFDKMPSDLEDAARIDGCNRIQIWWHVALPLARPALAVIVIYNSLNVWNEFILANLLLNDRALMPLQTGLMALQGKYLVDYPVLMAGLTITSVPILVFYLIVQKHIVKGLFSGAVVG